GGQAEPGAGAVRRRPRGAARRGRRGEGPPRRVRLHRLLRLPLRPHPRRQRTEGTGTAARFSSWRSCSTCTMASTLPRCDPDGETARVDPQELVVPKLSERFMGLRAAMVTNCPGVSSFAANLGFHVFGTEDFAAQSGSGSSSKDTRIIDRAFTLLGFAEGNVQDVSEFDLVFVHAAMENTASKLGKLGMKTDLNRLDKLVASVMEAVPVGSAVAARIHVSVILSYGSATENKEEACLIVNSSTETDSDLKLLRPRQSYTMKAGKTLDDVRNHHPMLLAQWQQGVTRSDLAKEFSFEEFIKRAGNFAMLAERFLHEVAFKLWKAPKYGA
uniref:Uncharacterized protein n=1 Tax=Aegilops tauschii subsp. strangulata TaxID=200361 RepID=A0A453N7V8_AEGTS